MAERPKRPRPGPKRNFSPDTQRMNLINSYRAALKQLVKSGGVSDPELAARIEAGWHPGAELAVMSVRPDLPDAIKTIILKTLLENSVISATDQARLDAGMDGPQSIQITIANYATAGRPPTSALEPPRASGVAAIDVVRTDPELEAHRGSVPTPAPREPAYQTFHVEDGNAVADPGGAILAPAAKPKRYVYDHDRGEYVKQE